MGMDAVAVDRIVGSEGRYRDFNRHFLPRREFLNSRWVSIDMAHYNDVPLPPCDSTRSAASISSGTGTIEYRWPV